MLWKKTEVNKYPDIILSDCKVTNIQVERDDITVGFLGDGFFKKDNKSNNFYRTNGAQIVIKGCDIDNISIKEVRTQRLSKDIYFETMYDLEVKDFFENINTGKWRLEIVEEFYAIGSGLYVGRIREDDEWYGW